MKMLLLLTISVLLGMCSNQVSNPESSSASPDGDMNVKEISLAEPSPLDPNTPPPPPPPKANTRVEQKLIRTADMSIEVDDYNDTRKELNTIFRKFSAQLSQEREQSLDYRIENQLVIRVKPVLLDSLIEAIGLIASDIDHKNITSEDVTRQYVDLESRLASKRAVIAQYQELLKSAKKISDILDINEKLNAVIEEIESVEAQLRTLRDQVQLSTLTLPTFPTPIRENSIFDIDHQEYPKFSDGGVSCSRRLAFCLSKGHGYH